MRSRLGLGCFRQVRDLLGKDHSKKMELKESPDRGVYVKDLSQFVCKNFDEMNKVLKVGAGWAAVPPGSGCHAACLHSVPLHAGDTPTGAANAQTFPPPII